VKHKPFHKDKSNKVKFKEIYGDERLGRTKRISNNKKKITTCIP
jgi:hypothetical protein